MKKAWFAVFLWAAVGIGQEKREEKVVVPLTKAELTALEQAAKKAHLDVPDFVRSKVLEGIEVEEEEAKKTDETDTKDETTKVDSPLKGWKVVSGQWRKEKNGVGSSDHNARLEWDGEVNESVEVQFTLTVRKWQLENPQGGVMLVWGQDDPAVSNNQCRIGPTGFVVAVRPAKPGISDTKVAAEMPVNTPIPVRAIISKTGVRMFVKGEKADVAIPCQEIKNLWLWLARSDVMFSNVKVKAK